MTKKQRKSSRLWCLSRPKGHKKDSEHRKLRRQLRKDGRRALRDGDEGQAKQIVAAMKQAKALKNAFVQKMRRSASRGT